jgi:MarR family transcriptional regulator, organic hydroperoxide resistance regulator
MEYLSTQHLQRAGIALESIAQSGCEADAPVPYDLTKSFPYAVNRVGVRMGELFSRRLQAHGLTLPMYRVLAALRQRAPQRLGELGEIVSAEPSTLSRLIGAMSRDRLVTRVRPEENARTVQIGLTDKGRALVEKLIPIAVKFEQVGVQSFTPQEAEWLRQALNQVYRNLDALDTETAP